MFLLAVGLVQTGVVTVPCWLILLICVSLPAEADKLPSAGPAARAEWLLDRHLSVARVFDPVDAAPVRQEVRQSVCNTPGKPAAAEAQAVILESLRTMPGRPTASAEKPAAIKRSLLTTLCRGDNANCYARALFLYLRACFNGCDASMMSVPGHVYVQIAPGGTYVEPTKGVALDPAASTAITTRPDAYLLSPLQIHSVLLFNIGTALARSGQYETAKFFLKEAQRFYYPHKGVFLNLAQVHYELQEYETALEVVKAGEFEQEDGPLQRQAMQVQLLVHMATGHLLDAQQLAKTLALNYPEDPAYYRVYKQLQQTRSPNGH